MGAVVLRNVEKSFDGKAACSGIDLDIAKGEFFTFLGPSGCGKTTILRLIAGFITPETGSILLDGRDITRIPPEKRQVGMVFQNYSLFPYLSVFQNIEYGLKIQKKSPAEIKEAVGYYMDLMGLAGYGGRKISELSGGEQQRVALARSLVIKPRVLLLDEPLSNLDARLRDKMRSEIKSLQKKLGITTIFVTHDQTEALTLSDRIAVFDKGRIIQVGSPQAVYDSPETSFVAGFVGETNLFEITVRGQVGTTAQGLDISLTGLRSQARYLSIRPQDVVLSGSTPDTDNVFKGVLEDIQLNGVWVDYLVRVGNTLIKAAGLNSLEVRNGIERGREIHVALPENRIRVLER